MDEKTLNRQAKREIKRLNLLLADFHVSENKIEILQPVIENTAWMKIKLDEARKAVKNSNVVIPYDNGGGQTGLRENPLFKGYESLWKSYMAGMCKIMECLPKEVVEVEAKKIEKPQTILEIVRKQKQA